MRIRSFFGAICCAAGMLYLGGCAAQQYPSLRRLPLVEMPPDANRLEMIDPQVRAVNAFDEAMQPQEEPAADAELIPPPPAAEASRNPPEEMPPAPQRPLDDGLRPINRLTVRTAPPPAAGAALDQAGLPEDLALERFGEDVPLLVQSEPFAPWNAYGQLVLSADFCHRPLYFEDINLERYGRSHGIAQPFISAARFYGAVPALPYKMVVEPPTVCLRDNSRWPAGGYAPHHRNLPPFDAKAGLVEAATIIGLIILIP